MAIETEISAAIYARIRCGSERTLGFLQFVANFR